MRQRRGRRRFGWAQRRFSSESYALVTWERQGLFLHRNAGLPVPFLPWASAVVVVNRAGECLEYARFPVVRLPEQPQGFPLRPTARRSERAAPGPERP